jgi:hypothetical protein
VALIFIKWETQIARCEAAKQGRKMAEEQSTLVGALRGTMTR